MKFAILSLALMFSAQASWALMSKIEVLTTASEDVIAKDQAEHIGGCGSTSTVEELLECAILQVQMPLNISGLPYDAGLEGTIDLGFTDVDGGCDLFVSVNTEERIIESNSGWVCE